MIFDRKALFSDGQAVTATAVSTDTVDLAPTGSNTKRGVSVRIGVVVTESAAAVGAATVDIQVQTSSDSAFTTPEVVASSGPIGKADLIAGKVIGIGLGTARLRRYNRLNYVVATGPLTAGKFTGGFALSIDDASNYAAAQL